MVLKLASFYAVAFFLFESDVISDGTQTNLSEHVDVSVFESDVISDGTQTCKSLLRLAKAFESDVISDGTQTLLLHQSQRIRLRVM